MAFQSPFRNLPYKTKGYLALGSGFLTHFILGTFYMWGSISTYIASYLQLRGYDFSKEIVNAVFPFTFLAINIGTPLGPYLAPKVGFRLYLMICSVALGVIIFCSSFALSNFYLFVFLYGFCFGLLTGLMYMVPFVTGYLYFPDKKGVVGGVITGGFGFGACIFIWVMFAMINPENVKTSVHINGDTFFPADVCNKLPAAIRVLGIIQIVGLSIAAALHERPQPDEIVQHEKMEFELTHHQLHSGEHSPPPGSVGINMMGSHNIHTEQFHIEEQHSHDHQAITDDHHHDEHPINKNGPQSDHISSATSPPQTQMMKPASSSSGNMSDNQPVINTFKGEQYYEFQSLKDGLKTPFIYASAFLQLIYIVFGSMIVSNYKLYGEYLNYGDSFLSGAGTAGSVFNGISRMFWGSIMEKFKVKSIILCNLALQIVLSITIQWAAKVQILFIIYIILGYFVYGGWYSMMPTLITRIYGKKFGPTIFGVSYVGYTMASFAQFFLVALVQKAMGWEHMFFVFTGIQVFAIIMTFLVPFRATPPGVKRQPSLAIGNKE